MVLGSVAVCMVSAEVLLPAWPITGDGAGLALVHFVVFSLFGCSFDDCGIPYHGLWLVPILTLIVVGCRLPVESLFKGLRWRSDDG